MERGEVMGRKGGKGKGEDKSPTWLSQDLGSSDLNHFFHWCISFDVCVCVQVMEKYPKIPMTPKEIWQLIEKEGLKEIR